MGNINQIATKYILSMDIDNLRKLHDKKYCNKLTDVTSKAIYQEGYNENKTGNKEEERNDKQDTCDKLAMFYIQIAHIYAVISLTLQPTLCEDESIKSTKKQKFCINKKQKDYKQGEGIQELMHLYYDSEYNPKTGEFKGMTEKTKQIFEQNLKDFYTSFTGNLIMPSNIKQFSDIKLHHYDTLNLPKQPKQYDTTSLFTQYSEHLKNMMLHVVKKQTELINILNRIFIVEENGVTTINPKLNEMNVQDIMIETRNCIVELHLKYEDDYNEGLKMHEAIVETLIFLTLTNEINALKNMLKYPSASVTTTSTSASASASATTSISKKRKSSSNKTR